MNSLEKIIMEEISALDDMRLIDVIGFIRYLKGEKPFKKSQVTDWFDAALVEIRERREELGIEPASLNVKTRRRGKQ
ncbi:MAG: hypothetical protein DCC59_12680 [Chloroflexi bacterium]|nr:hypothetical protein [Anaerolineales bacterium]MCE7918435.1 hypothetical protein [Chloroflexi bacterium CFX1]MCQ3951840.1 hypothetical protein [Chloroflexota bacterium]MDL1917796.1 hypothetical protein [Chloroflexi bacterium CFX5]MCK6568224.1 hypothetical protein [Anaerolineales bacterium]